MIFFQSCFDLWHKHAIQSQNYLYLAQLVLTLQNAANTSHLLWGQCRVAQDPALVPNASLCSKIVMSSPLTLSLCHGGAPAHIGGVEGDTTMSETQENSIYTDVLEDFSPESVSHFRLGDPESATFAMGVQCHDIVSLLSLSVGMHLERS